MISFNAEVTPKPHIYWVFTYNHYAKTRFVLLYYRKTHQSCFRLFACMSARKTQINRCSHVCYKGSSPLPMVHQRSMCTCKIWHLPRSWRSCTNIANLCFVLLLLLLKYERKLRVHIHLPGQKEWPWMHRVTKCDASNEIAMIYVCRHISIGHHWVYSSRPRDCLSLCVGVVVMVGGVGVCGCGWGVWGVWGVGCLTPVAPFTNMV